MLNSNALPGQGGISAEGVIRDYKFFDDTLQLIGALSPSTSTYNLDPVKGVTATVPTSRLMDRSDLFAVTGVGILFSRATYSSASSSLSAYGDYEAFTYPHSIVFSGSGEQAGLLNVVNGEISLNVQNDQQWALPVKDLVFKQAFINAQVQTIVYGGTDGQQGIRLLTNLVVLDGNNDNNVQVSLPTGGTLTNIDGNTNASTRNTIIVRLRGFRIRSAANGAFNAANSRC